jgi:hypothetical protein
MPAACFPTEQLLAYGLKAVRLHSGHDLSRCSVTLWSVFGLLPIQMRFE